MLTGTVSLCHVMQCYLFLAILSAINHKCAASVIFCHQTPLTLFSWNSNLYHTLATITHLRTQTDAHTQNTEYSFLSKHTR